MKKEVKAAMPTIKNIIKCNAGDRFFGAIEGTFVEGIIHKDVDGDIILRQNKKSGRPGCSPKTPGYKYGWSVESGSAHDLKENGAVIYSIIPVAVTGPKKLKFKVQGNDVLLMNKKTVLIGKQTLTYGEVEKLYDAFCEAEFAE